MALVLPSGPYFEYLLLQCASSTSTSVRSRCVARPYQVCCRVFVTFLTNQQKCFLSFANLNVCLLSTICDVTSLFAFGYKCSVLASIIAKTSATTPSEISLDLVKLTPPNLFPF